MPDSLTGMDGCVQVGLVQAVEPFHVDVLAIEALDHPNTGDVLVEGPVDDGNGAPGPYESRFGVLLPHVHNYQPGAE